MFESKIDYIPPFNSEIRKKVCKLETQRVDPSLFMTVTALFHERWPEFKIQNCLIRRNLSGFEFGFETESEVFAKIHNDPECLNFFWVEFDKDPSPYLDNKYKALPNHEKFFTEKLNQKVYIRTLEEENSVVFVFEHFNNRLFHAVQGFIPVYFPKFFKEKPWTNTEKNLLRALLTNTTELPYKRELENLLENELLRSFLIRTKLASFEYQIRRRKYEAAKNEVNDVETRLSSLLRDYARIYESKIDLQAKADGLKMAMNNAEHDTELEEYLSQNKWLTNINILDDRICFIVKTFVNPYLPDDWDSLSERGAIFEGHDDNGSCLDDSENLKLLLDAIFSRNHSLKLKVCGYIELNYYGENVNSVRHYAYKEADPNLRHYIPNAHLNEHNCFGRNLPDVLEQLSSGDVIGAVECCINVVKRINVSESASFNPFIGYIKSCKGKCIVSDDGQEMTCEEAVNYLKEKMNETATDNAGKENAA